MVFIRKMVEGIVNSKKYVIMLMHSYGGHVGSDALQDLDFIARSKKGLDGGVIHLVYLCALLLLEGECPSQFIKSNRPGQVCM